MSDFLTNQEVKVDDKGIIINNHFDVTDLAQENYEQRKAEIGSDSLKHSLHHIAAIPVFEFGSNPDLQRYTDAYNAGNMWEARVHLAKFLHDNPQYVATSKKF